MGTQKNLDKNLKLTLSQKLIPLNLILFFFIPAIKFGKYVNSFDIHYLLKIPLFYICCLTIPLLIFYIVTCITLLLEDILKGKTIDYLTDYFI